MQTSTRPRDYAAGQQRGRHGAHISISDDSHHVTDAISSLYDYGDHQQQQTPEQQHHLNHPPSSPRHHNHNQYQYQQNGPPPRSPPHDHHQQSSRPLSFLPSAREEIISSKRNNGVEDGSTRRNIVGRSKTMDRPSHSSNREYVVGRSNSVPHQHGLPPPSHPSGGLRSPADTATASFPLNDIDYESSPAAVAQELSNLQAIRRMSMNVDSASDPDLPTFGVPPASPTGAEDEDDASRLFWVPARLHPELAPTEFKTFLDKKVDQIKRRSGDFSSLSPGGVSRSSSGSGLQRKKSMLSRQINTDGKGGEGYQDGAERLERKRSASNTGAKNGMSTLQALEEMVNDPSRAIQRLSLDTQDMDSSMDEDMPILPIAPGANSLKRSTRTTYRRGSLREGKRVPPSRRAARAAGQAESDAEELSSPISGSNEPPPLPLQRVQTEPIPPPSQVSESKDKLAENFSRPGRGGRRVASPPPVQQHPTNNTASPGVSFDSILHHDNNQYQSPPERVDSKSPPPVPPVPKDLPPATSREPRPFVSSFATNGRSTAKVPEIVETPPQQEDSRSILQQSYRSDMPVPRAGKRQQGQKPEQQTLQHMASHPSPLPGNSTRTDSLSFIPTLPDEKRAEPKKEKDGSKKSGWSWGSLLGSEEKEKEKRREEEAREAKEASKKSKFKTGKSNNDNTRLDVLQTTMEGSNTRGRESLVLDRGDLKLEEERQKSSRKSSETKKEKDGLFSSLFGAGKRKGDRDRDPSSSASHKKSSRALSPDPPRPAPLLKPDVDYNWTRFSILEERAIYRMAHIKLANPRRALYSQVLLSNFMYSYLAKVQQMHPQMQIPQNAAQKAQQRAAQQQQQQQKKDQPEEFAQYQRYQEQQDRQDRQQQTSQPQSPTSINNNNGSYDDDGGGYGYQQQTTTTTTTSGYGFQQSQFDDPTKSDDDMW